jgi:hypothetical protein
VASEEHGDEVTAGETDADTTQVRQELPNLNCGTWTLHNPHPFRVDEKLAAASIYSVGQAAWCPGVLKVEHCGNIDAHEGHLWKDYTDLTNIQHYWCDGIGEAVKRQDPSLTTQQFWFQRNCGVFAVHNEHDWRDEENSDFHCNGMTPQAMVQYPAEMVRNSLMEKGHRLPINEPVRCGSSDIHGPHLLADMSRCVGVKPDGTGLYLYVSSSGARITYLIPWPKHSAAFHDGVLNTLGWPHHYDRPLNPDNGCAAILNINGQSVQCQAGEDEPFHIKEDTSGERTSNLSNLRAGTPAGHELPASEGDATTPLTGLLRKTGAIGPNQHAMVVPKDGESRTDEDGLEWVWIGTGWYAASPAQPTQKAVPDLKDLDVPKTPGEPIFGINDASGRSLVEFRIRDGKLDAKYYTEDLYPAARKFVEYLKLLGVEDDAPSAD